MPNPIEFAAQLVRKAGTEGCPDDVASLLCMAARLIRDQHDELSRSIRPNKYNAAIERGEKLLYHGTPDGCDE